MQIAESAPSSPQRKPARAFDSLAFAKRLQAGGVFTREQAEILAEEQAALIDDRLATKEDIATVNANIEALRLATQKDIETATQRNKAEILKWMFGTTVTQTVILLAAMIGILRAGVH